VSVDDSTVPSESSHWYFGSGVPPADEHVMVAPKITSPDGFAAKFLGQTATTRMQAKCSDAALKFINQAQATVHDRQQISRYSKL